MRIDAGTDRLMGATVTGLHLSSASETEVAELREAVYSNRILLIKDQNLAPKELVELGRALGTIEVYYEPMYHHPEHPEIFVSGTKPGESFEGVPQTGKFWHADYSFMAHPFGITMTSPQIVPKGKRGTYYIDMAKAFAALPEDLKDLLRGTRVEHSPRRYFKIRPSDVYRPIHELQAEIEEITPAVFHPTVFRHPVTGEEILYVSEAASFGFVDEDGRRLAPEILHEVLERTGQLDQTFTHPNIHLQTFTEGDLLVWDNRALVHRALHSPKPEPAQSYRVTVHDQHPFFGAGA
ncbi:(3R)-3-[(carboxymethyl)amino]fatty acid oxygenase/decarboxylase [Streptomyces olivaceoviridis]|uniref:Taurine catabolism dioxygenase n=2 Tax=Streptomyces canarius TaxID=285453 RepID=A0ABQ3D7Y7_9ACTN|nr:taurine catabolism dioxygenase [Streptomyces canarius]